MSKTFFVKFLVSLIAVACAVLWLLSEMDVLGFDFNLSLAVTIAAGGCGTLMILYGLFAKTLGTFKKLFIYIGAGLIIVAFIALIGVISMPENYVLPIIAIIIAVAFTLGLIAVGGKKWDQADNKNVGYKTYRERKEEEERARRAAGE